MIPARLDNATVYRMHDPKWAVTPTSGAGAAKHGGRVNRPGVEALYLALDSITAIQEYQQLSPLLQPGTLTSYQLTAGPVADFRQGYSASSWKPYWQDFDCDWRDLWFNKRAEPPSWIIGDEVIAAGVKGILFPSQMSNGGVNLVLYPKIFDSIVVYDPHSALPLDQTAWDK